MLSNRDKLADKVAKLLRQAEDVAGTPEEAAFQARAFEIMAKYGLEMTFVQAARSGLDVSDMPREAIEWIVKLDHGKYLPAQALALMSMARALHCRVCYITQRGGGYYERKPYAKVWVYGMPHHVDRLQMLWEVLRPQMLRMVEQAKPFDPYASTGEVKVFRRSWISGFANAVSARIGEQESKVIESAGGGALVLYKSDQEAAKDALAKAHPRLSFKRSNRQFDSSGYRQGQRDGRSASMSRSLAGGR